MIHGRIIVIFEKSISAFATKHFEAETKRKISERYHGMIFSIVANFCHSNIDESFGSNFFLSWWCQQCFKLPNKTRKTDISYSVCRYNASKEICARHALYRVLLWFGTVQLYPYLVGLANWHWTSHTIDPVPVKPLQWRHNEGDSVSNHQPHDCLLNRLFRRRSKKTSNLRVTGLCAGNSPETGEFPAQMASYAENVSIWWRHHEAYRILIDGPYELIM